VNGGGIFGLVALSVVPISFPCGAGRDGEIETGMVPSSLVASSLGVRTSLTAIRRSISRKRALRYRHLYPSVQADALKSVFG